MVAMSFLPQCRADGEEKEMKGWREKERGREGGRERESVCVRERGRGEEAAEATRAPSDWEGGEVTIRTTSDRMMTAVPMPSLQVYRCARDEGPL